MTDIETAIVITLLTLAAVQGIAILGLSRRLSEKDRVLCRLALIAKAGSATEAAAAIRFEEAPEDVASEGETFGQAQRDQAFLAKRRSMLGLDDLGIPLDWRKESP